MARLSDTVYVHSDSLVGQHCARNSPAGASCPGTTFQEIPHLLLLHRQRSLNLSRPFLYPPSALGLLREILLVHGIPQRNHRLRSHLGNLQAGTHKPPWSGPAPPNPAPHTPVCDRGQTVPRPAQQSIRVVGNCDSRIGTRPALRARSAADRDVGDVWILSDSGTTKPERIDFRLWVFHRHDHNKYRHPISAWK